MVWFDTSLPLAGRVLGGRLGGSCLAVAEGLSGFGGLGSGGVAFFARGIARLGRLLYGRRAVDVHGCGRSRSGSGLGAALALAAGRARRWHCGRVRGMGQVERERCFPIQDRLVGQPQTKRLMAGWRMDASNSRDDAPSEVN